MNVEQLRMKASCPEDDGSSCLRICAKDDNVKNRTHSRLTMRLFLSSMSSVKFAFKMTAESINYQLTVNYDENNEIKSLILEVWG